MSDDIETQEVTPEVTEEDGNLSDERSVEELKAELKKVRREAASRRVANNQKEAELAEFRKWKESQKTELQKAQERAAELEKLVADYEKRDMQLAAAKAAKLDLDLADRIRGNTPEEMLEDAKRLAEKTGKRSSIIDPFAGRGGAVRSPKNAYEALEEIIRKK